MRSRVIDLDQRRSSKTEVAPRRIEPTPRPPVDHVYEWDVDAVATLRTDPGEVPHLATVRWDIQIESDMSCYVVTMYREGWQHQTVLRSRTNPDETKEQVLHREGVILFLNALLSASYGVPA